MLFGIDTIFSIYARI